MTKSGPDRHARPWVDAVLAVPGPEAGTYVVGLHHGKQWVFPGGRVNRFESLQSAAVREFAEETGMNALVAWAEPFATFDEIDEANDYHRVVVAIRGVLMSRWGPDGSDDLRHVVAMTPADLIVDRRTSDMTRRIAWVLHESKA